MVSLFKVAVKSAVKDGVLTQAQAQQVLSRPLRAMLGGGPGGPGPEMARGRPEPLPV